MDRPSRSPYMKFSPKQTTQVARYMVETKNKWAIAKLSSSGASISRKVQSGGWSWNKRKLCDSDWSTVNKKSGQIVSKVAHCTLEESHTKAAILLSQNMKFHNTNTNYPYTNCKINTAKCLFCNKIAKFSHYTVHMHSVIPNPTSKYRLVYPLSPISLYNVRAIMVNRSWA